MLPTTEPFRGRIRRRIMEGVVKMKAPLRIQGGGLVDFACTMVSLERSDDRRCSDDPGSRRRLELHHIIDERDAYHSSYDREYGLEYP